MMRAKRSRSRAMSEDLGGDDHLLHMDPSLMTERQQLAFLLRKTAQEHSGGETHSSSDDDVPTRHEAKRTKKRIPPQHPHHHHHHQQHQPQQQRSPTTTTSQKTSPRRTRKAATPKAESPKDTPGRGRPARNASKAAEPDHTASVKAQPPSSARRGPKLVVQTSDSEHEPAPALDEASPMPAPNVPTSSKHAPAPTNTDAALSTTGLEKALEKTSPSSTSDLSHLDVFDQPEPDFWRLHCALCSPTASSLVDGTAADTLFLCASCDKKYPTQRQLGRV